MRNLWGAVAQEVGKRVVIGVVSAEAMNNITHNTSSQVVTLIGGAICGVLYAAPKVYRMLRYG